MGQLMLSSGSGGIRQIRYLGVMITPARPFRAKYPRYSCLKSSAWLCCDARNRPARIQAPLSSASRRSARYATFRIPSSSSMGYLWMRKKSTSTFLNLFLVRNPHQSAERCYSSNSALPACSLRMPMIPSRSKSCLDSLGKGCCWQLLLLLLNDSCWGCCVAGVGVVVCPGWAVVLCLFFWQRIWLLMLGQRRVIFSLSMRIVISLLRSPSLSLCCLIFSLARRAMARVSYSTSTQVRWVGSQLRFTSIFLMKPNRLKIECKYCQLVNCGSFLTEAQTTGMRFSLISYCGLLLTTLNRLRWSAKKILKLALWVLWCRVVLMLWQSAQALEASSTLKYFTKTKFLMISTSSISPYLAKKDLMVGSAVSYIVLTMPLTYSSRTRMHSWMRSGAMACSASSSLFCSGSFMNISWMLRSQLMVLLRRATLIFCYFSSALDYSSVRFSRLRERECRGQWRSSRRGYSQSRSGVGEGVRLEWRSRSRSPRSDRSPLSTRSGRSGRSTRSTRSGRSLRSESEREGDLLRQRVGSSWRQSRQRCFSRSRSANDQYCCHSGQLRLIRRKWFIIESGQMDKNVMTVIDKTTRNRIFNSRFWKEECFALNAESIIDKAVKIKCIGGLYGGSKKPSKFLCLVLKMLQMNLSKEIALLYLAERDYKYLTAMAMMYLRLTVKAPEIYHILQPFYVDNRKLKLRNNLGDYELTYIDQFVENLLSEQTCLGLNLPFIPRRLALENQGALEPRKSLIEQELNAGREIGSMQKIEQQEEYQQ